MKKGAPKTYHDDTAYPAERLRRNWWPPAIGLAATVGALALTQSWDKSLVALGVFGLFVGPTLAIGSAARNSWPRARPVNVRVEPLRLIIGDDPPIEAEAIAEARCVTGELGLPELHLELRGGERRWLRLGQQSARIILETLGLEAGGRRASFPLQTRLRSRWGLSTLSLALLFVLKMAPSGYVSLTETLLLVTLWSSLVGLLVAWGLGSLLRGRVVVGADGYTERWLLWPARYVPFSEVAKIEQEPTLLHRSVVDTVVKLRDGRTHRLVAREAPTNESQRGAESRALHEHLTEAFARAQQRERNELPLEALVAPAHQSGAEWLASLDALERGGVARYRVAAPAAEQLTDVVLNPSLPSAARAGAAAMWLRRGDPESRRAVRVVAEGCAQPALRETLLALEQAQDDEAFIAALEKVERKAQG